MKEQNKVIYCSHCQMWFDTKNGWFAKTSKSIGPMEKITNSGKKIAIPDSPGIPFCPACGSPLFEIEANKFYEANEKAGRLQEVMTWEWPNGSFWRFLKR